VLLAVVAVLAVTMIVAGVAVSAIFNRQANTAADELLTSRLQLARQLAAQDLTPRQLVNRVDAQGVRATLTLQDGSRFGSDPVPGPQRHATLAGTGRLRGAKLVLSVDTALLDDARSELRRALLITGGAALLFGALLAMLVSSFAVQPLRRMAHVAQRIAAGQRGIRLHPTNGHSEIGQVACAMDAMLDELEQSERRALDSEHQARTAERRIKDFLADAAHELRTPLAGVSTSAETLLHQSLSLEQRQQLLSLLVQESRRGSRLMDDLLAVARLDAGVGHAVGPVDLAALAGAERDRVTALHPGLPVTVTGRSAVALADPGAVQTIVRNLLDNAARAAGRDGRVEITVGEGTSGPGDPVLLDVADSGSGIADDDLERIFDRLVRLDQHRSRDNDGGSGLGLAIARGHARANHGDLVCLPSFERPSAPEPLGGAVFRLSLPRYQATRLSIC
jgi:signal transduction histidine kinase